MANAAEGSNRGRALRSSLNLAIKGVADLGKGSFSGVVGRRVRLEWEMTNWK